MTKSLIEAAKLPETHIEGKAPVISSSRIDRFVNCGSHATVQQAVAVDGQVRFRVVSQRCHDPFCEACRMDRSRTITHNLEKYLSKHPRAKLRLITLTLRTKAEQPLKQTLDELLRCQRNLFRHPVWRAHVVGGSWFLEITYNRTAKRWHPHLHLIVEGTYFDQAELSDLWKFITGGSSVVDVRMIGETKKALRYISKYVAKDNGLPINNAQLVAEYAVAIKSRRMTYALGTWFGEVQLLAEPDDEETWISVGELKGVVKAAMKADPEARTICRHLGIDWRMFDQNLRKRPKGVKRRPARGGNMKERAREKQDKQTKAAQA